MSQRLCGEEGCERPHYAKGWCTMHYQRATPRTRLRRSDCEFEGCINPRNGKTYCVQHERQLKAGKELAPLQRRRFVVDGMKECTDCSKVLPVDEFYPHSKSRDGEGFYLSPRCKECHGLQNRFRRYGVTRDEIIDLLARPCDACGQEIDKRFKMIDHDHDTDEVRGVLCNGCNVALGMVNENPDALRGLIAYIERTRSNL